MAPAISSTEARQRILFLLDAFQHDTTECTDEDTCEMCSWVRNEDWIKVLRSHVDSLDTWMSEGGSPPDPWGRAPWLRLDNAARTHESEMEEATDRQRALVAEAKADAYRDAIKLLGLREPDKE